MKLYLSSKHVPFPEALVSLVDKNPNDSVVHVVTNAFDNYEESRRAMHIKNLIGSITAAGFKCNLLDLRKYVKDQAGLMDILKNTDLLWVSGGNVFYLRYLFRQCGLDNELSRLLEQGLVYGGDSAGAAVLGGDIHGLDLLDDPDQAPEVIFEGMGITPFIVLPHWGNERYKDEIAKSRAILEKWNEEVITISDSQVCVVNGQTKEVLGLS